MKANQRMVMEGRLIRAVISVSQGVPADQVSGSWCFLLVFVMTFDDIDNDDNGLQNQENRSSNSSDLPCFQA